MTVIDRLVGITAQHNEIVKRVGNGSLDADLVRKALQDIIEGKFLTVTPAVPVHTWWISPGAQLERVTQLNAERNWGFSDSDFPSIPEGFTPRTATEVLLLAVYLPKRGKVSGLQRTFDELWDLIQAPDGYTKWRWDELNSDSKHLRSAGQVHKPGIRWVAFDPNAFHGKSPEQALSNTVATQVYLAGVEVLMAALLFPTWSASWNGDSSPFPNMSGLQFYWNTGWSRVPCLRRWDVARRLLLTPTGLAASARAGRRLRSGSADTGTLVPWYPGGSCNLGLRSPENLTHPDTAAHFATTIFYPSSA